MKREKHAMNWYSFPLIFLIFASPCCSYDVIIETSDFTTVARTAWLFLNETIMSNTEYLNSSEVLASQTGSTEIKNAFSHPNTIYSYEVSVDDEIDESTLYAQR